MKIENFIMKKALENIFDIKGIINLHLHENTKEIFI